MIYLKNLLAVLMRAASVYLITWADKIETTPEVEVREPMDENETVG